MKMVWAFVCFALSAVDIACGVLAAIDGKPTCVIAFVAAAFCFGCGIYNLLSQK